jgi:pimeloyl-ACP methyl ester carboxylesterase
MITRMRRPDLVRKLVLIGTAVNMRCPSNRPPELIAMASWIEDDAPTG